MVHVRESQNNLGWKRPQKTAIPLLSSKQRQLPSSLMVLFNLALEIFKGWDLSPSLTQLSIIQALLLSQEKKKVVFPYIESEFHFLEVVPCRNWAHEKSLALSHLWLPLDEATRSLLSLLFPGQSGPALSAFPYTPCTSEEILRSKTSILKHRKACTAISRCKLQLLLLKLSGSISLAVCQGWVSSILCQTAGKNRCPENIFFGSFFLLFPL